MYFNIEFPRINKVTVFFKEDGQILWNFLSGKIILLRRLILSFDQNQVINTKLCHQGMTTFFLLTSFFSGSHELQFS